MATDYLDAGIITNEIPVKGVNEQNVTMAQVRAQIDLNRANIVPVDYANTPGSCPDERPHEGAPRPAVFGGPNVYALLIAELTGVFPEDGSNGASRLMRVTKQINDGGVASGGHEDCKANAALGGLLHTIAHKPAAVIPYVSQELREEYDQSTMDEVSGNAQRADISGRYADWSEAILRSVLGQEAETAIERVASVPHEGLTLVKNNLPNTTIDQTAVYEQSIIGPGTFDFDVAYSEKIEDVMTSGPDAVHMQRLARHAREAIIAAVAEAVPNPTLFQGSILPE